MWYNLFELFNKAWKITSDSESYNVGVGQLNRIYFFISLKIECVKFVIF